MAHWPMEKRAVLYFAVGLHAAPRRVHGALAPRRHHDAQNWPAPACVPRLAPQAPARLRLERATSTSFGSRPAVQGDTIRAAFQMRSVGGGSGAAATPAAGGASGVVARPSRSHGPPVALVFRLFGSGL